jgi:hypothetical protein
MSLTDTTLFIKNFPENMKITHIRKTLAGSTIQFVIPANHEGVKQWQPHSADEPYRRTGSS